MPPFVHKFCIEYTSGDLWVRGPTYLDLDIAILATGARHREWRILHEPTGLICCYQSPGTGFMRASWAREGRWHESFSAEDEDCFGRVNEPELVAWDEDGF